MSTASNNIYPIKSVGYTDTGTKDFVNVTVARDLNYPSRSTCHIQWHQLTQAPIRVSKTQDLRSTVAFEYAPDDEPQDVSGLDTDILSLSDSSASSINQGGRFLGDFKCKIHAVFKNLRRLPQKVLSFIRIDRAHAA